MPTNPAISREHAVLSAIFTRDEAAMAELMSTDGFGLHAKMGLVKPPELIAGIDALSSDAGFFMEEIQVASLDSHIVMLAYLLRQWGTFGDKALPAAVYCSSVWALKDGKWRAIFHRETLAGGLT